MPARRPPPRVAAAAAALLAAFLLPGCMGGPIARQVASSLAMQAADRVAGHFLDEPAAEPRGETNMLLVNTGIDPYQAAFLRAELALLPPAPAPHAPPAPEPAPAAAATASASRLETVEIAGLILGAEKREMLEGMRQVGLSLAPPETEWERWQLAEGRPPGREDARMLFLIPPELGRMKSGDRAVVELASGGVHIARDRLD